MCRRLSPLNAVAFVFLIGSTLTCLLSFTAPFWVVYPHALKWWKVEAIPSFISQSSRETFDVAWKGLLAYCYCYDQQKLNSVQSSQLSHARDVNCRWFWEDNFHIQKSLPAWYKASQIVYMAALSFLGLALLLQCIYSCCRCCKQPGRFPTFVASFTITGGLLVFLSLGLFGGLANAEGWFDKSSTSGFIAQLEWSFFVGIGGAGGACFAAIFFFLDGCGLSKTYRGYSNPKT